MKADISTLAKDCRARLAARKPSRLDDAISYVRGEWYVVARIYTVTDHDRVDFFKISLAVYAARETNTARAIEQKESQP